MNIDNALNFIIEQEGGYVNDPRDPGGETNYGISKRSYPDEDIKNLTLDRAKEIYKKDYWKPCGCDGLPAGIALCVFDSAVNQGVRFACQQLQYCVGAFVDGVIGPRTKSAVWTVCKKGGEAEFNLIINYTTSRILKYTRTKNFDVYGQGWVRRAANAAMTAVPFLLTIEFNQPKGGVK